MKKIIFGLIIILLSQTMVAVADAGIIVPPAVSAAFAARFPDTKVRKWSTNRLGYMAMFKHKWKKEFAYFKADGTWEATEIALSWSWNLPDAVRKAYKSSEYAWWKIERIKKIEQPGEPVYMLDVNSSTLYDSDHTWVYAEEWVIVFNEKGEMVRKYQRG